MTPERWLGQLVAAKLALVAASDPAVTLGRRPIAGCRHRAVVDASVFRVYNQSGSWESARLATGDPDRPWLVFDFPKWPDGCVGAHFDGLRETRLPDGCNGTHP